MSRVNLRVAIVPLLGMGNFRKDSNWREWHDIIQATNEIDNVDVHWYMFVPKLESNDYEPIDNTTLIPVPIDVGNYYPQQAKRRATTGFSTKMKSVRRLRTHVSICLRVNLTN